MEEQGGGGSDPLPPLPSHDYFCAFLFVWRCLASGGRRIYVALEFWGAVDKRRVRFVGGGLHPTLAGVLSPPSPGNLRQVVRFGCVLLFARVVVTSFTLRLICFAGGRRGDG